MNDVFITGCSLLLMLYIMVKKLKYRDLCGLIFWGIMMIMITILFVGEKIMEMMRYL